MKTSAWPALVLAAICISAGLLCAANGAQSQSEAAKTKVKADSSQTGAQAAAASAPQTAERKFKNIQVLKGIPADQLIPSMQFIAASLGVECEYCHVQHAFDKDDKKTKLAARKMMTMMMQIDTDNFKGEREVTCYTCHRGSVHPVGIPILSAENAPAPPTPTEDATPVPALPSPQAILDKYLAAVGGAEAVQKTRTRIQTGNIEVSGKKFPIEVYSQAPNQRVSTSHMGPNVSATAYNGETGWLSTPNGVRPMSPAEQQAASIDAQLYFPEWLPKAYQDFKTLPAETIDGKNTYLVSAIGTGQVPLNLYFDQQSGLLLRLVRFAETPLGKNPTQIDYADYRAVDGLKIPYRWTLARPNGRFTIQIDEVKQNVPVDEKLFVMPDVPKPPNKPE
jgi:photosynthetic reaction center cytochrome c subunit